jgi:hypothetical protein
MKSEFDQIVKDEYYRREFHQFLKMEFGEENLMFFMDVESFKLTLDEQKAMQIVENYLKDNAQKEVNVSYKAKQSVLEKVQCKDFGQDLFGEAESEIVNLLVLGPLIRFKTRVKGVARPLYVFLLIYSQHSKNTHTQFHINKHVTHICDR